MADIILERHFGDEAIDLDAVKQMTMAAGGCLDIYSIDWQFSMLSKDGSSLFCHFQAPDTEAVRNMARFTNSDYHAAWAGDIHEGDEGEFNVLVERSWDEPVDFEVIAAREEEGAWCLEAHNVSFIRSYFSKDKRRMICLYRAPDAESVRQAQSKAELPYDNVWAFQKVTRDLLFGEN